MPCINRGSGVVVVTVRAYLDVGVLGVVPLGVLLYSLVHSIVITVMCSASFLFFPILNFMRPLPKKIMSAVFICLLASSCLGGPWSPRSVPESHNRKIQECDNWKQGTQMIKLPVFSQAWQIVENCNEYSGEAVAIAMVFFYNEWSLSFGDPAANVWAALNKLMVEWSYISRPVTAYDVSGRLIQDARASGIALTQSMIWVKPIPGRPICESSLVHELVHIAIWSIKLTDGDPDHLGKVYSGWTVDHSALIQRVNDQLCSLGI